MLKKNIEYHTYDHTYKQQLQREINTKNNKNITKGLVIPSTSSTETCCPTPYEKNNNKIWLDKLTGIYKTDYTLWKIIGGTRNRILILQHPNNSTTSIRKKLNVLLKAFLRSTIQSTVSHRRRHKPTNNIHTKKPINSSKHIRMHSANGKKDNKKSFKRQITRS